ncbi:hypothetical protein SASPL_131265 [Salvia splendens]|nr:hypothetical protein SASPL_131265 [Salvia splendens]
MDADVVSQKFALELVSDDVPSKVGAPSDGVVLSVASKRVTDSLFVTDPSDEALKLCEFSSHEVDGDDALLAVESAQIDAQYMATPTPSDSDYTESCLEQQNLLGVGDQNLFRLEQTLTTDGRSIPPRVLSFTVIMNVNGEDCGVEDGAKMDYLVKHGLELPHREKQDEDSVATDIERGMRPQHEDESIPTCLQTGSVKSQVPSPCPLNLEMEILLDHFTAKMTKQQGENMKQPYYQISVSCPLSTKLSRQFYAPFSVLGWHSNSELYANVVHKGDTSKAGHYYSFIHLHSTEWYISDDSRVSAADGDEVFEQMAYILLYAPHSTLWFTDFILALQSSNGFASLVASQLLPTFELGQGDATILPHDKEGNGLETNGDYKQLQTTISFVPDFTEQCQDEILCGGNGAGEADKDPSLTSENNLVADGDEGLFADEYYQFAFWQLLFLCIWLDPSDVLKRKQGRVFLVLLHATIFDHLKEVENNVIMVEGFNSEEESSWIDVVANLGGEIHAASRELGDHVENDLSLDFGIAACGDNDKGCLFVDNRSFYNIGLPRSRLIIGPNIQCFGLLDEFGNYTMRPCLSSAVQVHAFDVTKALQESGGVDLCFPIEDEPFLLGYNIDGERVIDGFFSRPWLLNKNQFSLIRLFTTREGMIAYHCGVSKLDEADGVARCLLEFTIGVTGSLKFDSWPPRLFVIIGGGSGLGTGRTWIAAIADICREANAISREFEEVVLNVMLLMIQAHLLAKRSTRAVYNPGKNPSIKTESSINLASADEGLEVQIGAEMASLEARQSAAKEAYMACGSCVLLQFRALEHGVIKLIFCCIFFISALRTRRLLSGRELIGTSSPKPKRPTKPWPDIFYC